MNWSPGIQFCCVISMSCVNLCKGVMCLLHVKAEVTLYSLISSGWTMALSSAGKHVMINISAITWCIGGMEMGRYGPITAWLSDNGLVVPGSKSSGFWPLRWKIESCHAANFVITGGTTGCRWDFIWFIFHMNVIHFGPLKHCFCPILAKQIKKINQIFENFFTNMYIKHFCVVFYDHLGISKLNVVGRPDKDRSKIQCLFLVLEVYYEKFGENLPFYKKNHQLYVFPWRLLVQKGLSSNFIRIQFSSC